MVAVLLEIDTYGRVQAAAVAIGACSEVAQRLSALESEVLARRLPTGAFPRLSETSIFRRFGR